MRILRRVLCLTAAVLLLVVLAPQSAGAADVVYFTAVNDHLLPLNDETMPFWAGGVLYVAYTAFDGSDLGTFYSRSRDKMTAVLYRQRSGALICDFAAGTIYDNSSRQVLGGPPVTRGDIVFLPVEVICRFFGLQYTYTRINYGFLVRIKSESAVLSDTTFIDAADNALATRYNQYQRASAAGSTEPATPSSGGGEAQGGTEAQGETTPERTVYLAVDVTSPAQAEAVLEHFPIGQGTFLFAPQALDGAGDLLRRLSAGAGTIALHVDASGGTAAALHAIEEGNRAIWAAANTKTRLVRLDGAREETLNAVVAAGYCPLRFALDYSESAISAGRISARILSVADANRGTCRVLLGTDEAAAGMIGTLLSSLRNSNCTLARLTETAA